MTPCSTLTTTALLRRARLRVSGFRLPLTKASLADVMARDFSNRAQRRGRGKGTTQGARIVGAIDWKAKRGKCPSCGRDGEDGSLGTLGIGKFDEGPRRGEQVAHCYRCGCVVWPDVPQQADETREHRQGQEKRATLSEWGHKVWNACGPLSGDAQAYLKARRCVVPPAEGHLRYHPALKHRPSGLRGPALVALVTDAVTGQPMTLHRTWIRADGSKAPLDPPRMLLGGHRKAGGVVRLWPDEAVTLGLGIAEGIETALSLAHAFKPVWALIDAGNLATMPVLGGVESLTVAADHDQAGLDAAAQCADRWTQAAREVFVVTSNAEKQDLNDMAAA